MAYVESSLISRTGYAGTGDAHFDADLKAAYKAHQGVNGLGDLATWASDNMGLIAGGIAAYVLLFKKKR